MLVLSLFVCGIFTLQSCTSSNSANASSDPQKISKQEAVKKAQTQYEKTITNQVAPLQGFLEVDDFRYSEYTAELSDDGSTYKVRLKGTYKYRDSSGKLKTKSFSTYETVSAYE